MDERLSALLAEKFGAVPAADGVVNVDRARLIEVARFLRDEEGFRFLRDVCAVDMSAWTGWRARSTERFEVHYPIMNIEKRRTLMLAVRVDDGAEVPSLVPIYPTADFLEREVYDLMGVRFAGHPDLRRILLSDDWEGHPHRKDYPVSGYEMWKWDAHR